MRILFGKRTEKDKPEEGKNGKDNTKPPPDAPTAAGNPDVAGGSGGKTEPAGPDSEDEEKKSKTKGHGRNPASAYENAPEIVCPVCGNKAGDRCPACGRGRLRNEEDEIVIRVKGSAPVTADRYKVEKAAMELPVSAADIACSGRHSGAHAA